MVGIERVLLLGSGVRSGGLARGIRVVVEMVWIVYSCAGEGEGAEGSPTSK